MTVNASPAQRAHEKYRDGDVTVPEWQSLSDEERARWAAAVEPCLAAVEVPPLSRLSRWPDFGPRLAGWRDYLTMPSDERPHGAPNVVEFERILPTSADAPGYAPSLYDALKVQGVLDGFLAMLDEVNAEGARRGATFVAYLCWPSYRPIATGGLRLHTSVAFIRALAPAVAASSSDSGVSP